MDIATLESGGVVSTPVQLTIKGIECIIRIEVDGTDDDALQRLAAVEAALKGLLG